MFALRHGQASLWVLASRTALEKLQRMVECVRKCLHQGVFLFLIDSSNFETFPGF